MGEGRACSVGDVQFFPPLPSVKNIRQVSSFERAIEASPLSGNTVVNVPTSGHSKPNSSLEFESDWLD